MVVLEYIFNGLFWSVYLHILTLITDCMQKKGDYEGEKVTLRWISISIQDTQTILWGYDIEKNEGCKKGGRETEKETEAEEERRADWRTHWVVWYCFDFLHWVLTSFI